MKRKAVIFILLIIFLLPAGCSLEDIPLQLDKDSSQEDIFDDLEPEPGDEGENPGEPFPPENIRPTMLYYLDNSGEYVVPLTRYLPETETNIRDSLMELISKPGLNENLAELGLDAPLPGGTEILGLNLTEAGLLTIDFNSRFLDYPPASERQVITAIVYTVIQFNEVSRVEFQVEGDPLSTFPGGLQLTPPLAGEIGINLEVSDQVENYSNALGVTLFYYIRPETEGRTLMIPVMRVIPSQEDIYSAAINSLLNGPEPGSLLFSALPPETALLAADLEGDTITVNLSDDVYNFAGGKSGETALLQQLAATVMALDNSIQHMVLQVEGAAPAFPHGTPAEHPATLLPAEMNEVRF